MCRFAILVSLALAACAPEPKDGKPSTVAEAARAGAAAVVPAASDVAPGLPPRGQTSGAADMAKGTTSRSTARHISRKDVRRFLASETEPQLATTDGGRAPASVEDAGQKSAALAELSAGLGAVNAPPASPPDRAGSPVPGMNQAPIDAETRRRLADALHGAMTTHRPATTAGSAANEPGADRAAHPGREP